MYLKFYVKHCLQMMSPITWLWAMLSIMVAATCTFSFLQPFWFLHPDFTHSFGMLNFCHQDANHSGRPRPMCRNYGGYFQFGNIPSAAWQVAAMLFGCGCLFSIIGALLAVVALLTPTSMEQKIATACGYIQSLAVLIMTAGLLIYPLGLPSEFFQHYCGESVGIFRSGYCQIGWSYMLAIMGVCLAIFCPVLSRHTDIKANDIGISPDYI